MQEPVPRLRHALVGHLRRHEVSVLFRNVHNGESRAIHEHQQTRSQGEVDPRPLGYQAGPRELYMTSRDRSVQGSSSLPVSPVHAHLAEGFPERRPREGLDTSNQPDFVEDAQNSLTQLVANIVYNTA